MSTMCAGIPFARRLFGLRCAWCMRRRGGAIGGLKHRKGRMGRIGRRWALAHLGRCFTMSTAGLGNARLSGRRSGDGSVIRRAALRWRMATTVGDVFRAGGGNARRELRGFGGAFGGVRGGRRWQGGASRMLSAKMPIEQCGRFQNQRSGSPIPVEWQTTVFTCIDHHSEVSNRPGAMVFPQLQSMGLVGGIAGRRRHMRGSGATWAIARIGPLCDVSLFSTLGGPGTGSQDAYQDATAPFTSVEKDFGRLVGHD